MGADGVIPCFLIFFFLVCISYFQKPTLEKKKKSGGYFAERFLAEELACGDAS